MEHIDETIFHQFCSISQKVQQIQQTAEKEEITPDLRVELHKELEKAQDSLASLRTGAQKTTRFMGQASPMDAVEKQIISLYRIVEEGFEKHEIRHISQQALDISHQFEKGEMGYLAQKVDQLKHNIQFLYTTRCPSMKNRKVIDLAKKLVDHSNLVLETKKKLGTAELQRFQLLRGLLQAALQQIELFADPEDAEVAMEMCEIADLLRKRQRGEALVQLQFLRPRLSNDQTRQIDEVAQDSDELARVLLELAGGNPELDDAVLLAESTGTAHVLGV